MNRAITMIAYTLIPIIAGCASTGSHTSSGREIANIQESLSKGEIRLTCDTACSGSWGAKRKEMKSLYENELWEDLASTVARLGFRSDQTYYYLGRSAKDWGIEMPHVHIINWRRHLTSVTDFPSIIVMGLFFLSCWMKD